MELAESPSIYSRTTSFFLSVTAHTGIFSHAKVTRRTLPPRTYLMAAYTIISMIKNLSPLATDEMAESTRTPMSSLHTPKQNLFLAMLPENAYERMKSCLEPVCLPQGWVVYESGGELDLVYFPTTSVISLLAHTPGGEPVKVTIIGNEGVFGISMLPGQKKTLDRAVVQSAGYGYRLKASHLRKEFELGGPLRYLLQRYTQNLNARIAQSLSAIELARSVNLVRMDPVPSLPDAAI